MTSNDTAPDIRLFNVKFSPNLGDGLLSECLESALIGHGGAATTHSVDLAAREQYCAGSGGRSAKMRVLEAMPGLLRRHAVRLPLALEAKRKWQPHYRAGLTGADAVVIGGGNLLADLDLNFPTKLSLAIHAAADAGLPVFIYGCGVSSGWSVRGTDLLHIALARGAVKQVFLRDERSARLWSVLAGHQFALPATIVRDPGLLASRTYLAQPRDPQAQPMRLGLNVTSQIALQYHADDAPTAPALLDWYAALVREWLARGYQPVVFTNGSPEDRTTLAQLRALLAAEGQAEGIAFPDAETPTQLMKITGALDGLVAFRMHSIIAAYSFGVPLVGLAWDAKLASFLASVGLSDSLLRVTDAIPNAVADLLDARIRQGTDDAKRDLVLTEARRDVGALYTAIQREIAS